MDMLSGRFHVTKHFIFNIVGGYFISAMKKRKDAIHECKYLEKLVYDKGDKR